jgi:hypothetical protein
MALGSGGVIAAVSAYGLRSVHRAAPAAQIRA